LTARELGARKERVRMSERPFSVIHVGFANTGTTSLQLNFFSNRNDIFYVGEPYRNVAEFFRISDARKISNMMKRIYCDCATSKSLPKVKAELSLYPTKHSVTLHRGILLHILFPEI
jgi:hypothetical protein